MTAWLTAAATSLTGLFLSFTALLLVAILVCLSENSVKAMYVRLYWARSVSEITCIGIECSQRLKALNPPSGVATATHFVASF